MFNERDIIRPLAEEIARIASLPEQEEKRRLWRSLNALKPERPMVMIDQICWNEIVHESLELKCRTFYGRYLEQELRRVIYQWNHFPGDMVVEPYITIPLAVSGTDFGITVEESIAVTDKSNDVVSHSYANLFKTDKDLERIQTPHVRLKKGESALRMFVANRLLGGILEARPGKVDPYLSLWDPIATWMGVENAMMAMMDRPEYVHQMLERMTSGYLSMLDQLENKGLLCGPQSLIHCTGAYSDELPAGGYDSRRPRTQDIWMFGLAQMFSSVSPSMFDEFEVAYASRICDRFGLVYYGCCDPLDRKMEQVRKIPNVRKISMSPWVEQEIGAAEIKSDYVFSRKPNPAFLATEGFNETMIRDDLRKTVRICRESGSPLEIILKDISTIRRDHDRLSKWEQIAMEVVREEGE